MSVYALSWAWSQSVGDSSAKLVLLSLADHANDSGICWPGLARIAEKSELSRATVKRALLKLETLELLDRDRRGRGADGVLLTTIYRLRMPVAPAPGRRGSRRSGSEPPAAQGSGQPEPTQGAGGGLSVSLPRAQPEPGVGSPTTGGRVTGEPLTARNRQEPKEGVAHATQLDRDDETGMIAAALFVSCRMGGRPTEIEVERARVAAAMIRRADPELGVDRLVAEISARAGRWSTLFGDRTITPSAISANWSRLAPPASVQISRDPEQAARNAENLRRTELESEIRGILRALDHPADLVRIEGETVDDHAARARRAYRAHVDELATGRAER